MDTAIPHQEFINQSKPEKLMIILNIFPIYL
jgi:hypothetical protein